MENENKISPSLKDLERRKGSIADLLTPGASTFTNEQKFDREIKKEIVKVIGRISKKGNEYFQTAINVEGREENEFIPVFLKKGVEKLSYISMENKTDKRGVVYTLYEVPARNVFFPKEENGKVLKAIVTR